MNQQTNTDRIKSQHSPKKLSMKTVAYRIDVHHHILPPAYVAALRRVGVDHEGGVPLPHWDAEHAIALMDRQGIATAITSISALASTLEIPDWLVISRDSVMNSR